MRWRRPLTLFIVALLAIGTGTAVSLLTKAGPQASRNDVDADRNPPRTRTRSYTPDELLKAIVAQQIDPSLDGEIVRSVLDSMDAASRSAWLAEIAGLVGALDPATHGWLQRRMAFVALERGELDAAWTILSPLVECSTCAARDRDDALRLLDQYTPLDDPRRVQHDARVLARASQILNDPSRDTAALPLVWSSFAQLGRAGRIDEAVEMRSLYLERFTGVITPEAVTTARQNLAHDLTTLGRHAEAAPHFRAAADSYRSSLMTESRADYLVHAARAGQPEGAVGYLESALADPAERVSPASALIYLELLLLQQQAGDAASAERAAQHFWDSRNEMTGMPSNPVILEHQATLFYHAAALASSAGRRGDAAIWTNRILEVAPQSSTAAAIRRAATPTVSP